ncbi:MAG: hypothetical protein ACLR2E_14165 [Lachnospiraceae bacterium]
MKKLNFRTFKFQIVLLFLLMSVPAMGLAFAASYTITEEAQEQIIDARQNNMKILVSQYDAGMESVINYIELLLFRITAMSACSLTRARRTISRPESG